MATSGSEGSESASESEQNDPPSSLASDAELYEHLLFIWLRKWLLYPSDDPDPSYQEASTGEKNRPSSGLVCIAAHPRPPKKLAPDL